jgi:cobalt transport protein ATP-binding subunit
MPITHPVKPSPPAPADVKSPALLVSHLEYAYPGGHLALKGVSLVIGNGDKVALVGPNGAGKSTLVLHLNGILTGTGEIYIEGTRLEKRTLPGIRSRLGMVFQNPDDQLFSPTVFDDVAFGPLHMGVSHDDIHRRVEQALDAVGMAGFERRLPSHLSIGQRKRVALATVLSMDPSVLVFDEPSAGLDPRGRRQLIELLKGLTQTLIVATHDMRLVAEVLPRTIIMDGGVVVADGPSAEILGDDPLLERHGLERP